jgi:hypothetical protein
MSIVMGLDQHRAQITAEWVDTTTGEIGRTRVRPADRAGVRRFLGRFGGQRLEVALEATTGWRFVVGELQAIGADVHLAESAETAARRGRKKCPKTDRADARHLRELLMVDRLRSRGSRPSTSSICAHACGCAMPRRRSRSALRHARPALVLQPGTRRACRGRGRSGCRGVRCRVA